LNNVNDQTNLEQINRENDKMIMRFYGFQYEKLFPQEHQDDYNCLDAYYVYSLISQNAPVLQCLQDGKVSPAVSGILFSFSVG
jgi:hypothetical protein